MIYAVTDDSALFSDRLAGSVPELCNKPGLIVAAFPENRAHAFPLSRQEIHLAGGHLDCRNLPAVADAEIAEAKFMQGCLSLLRSPEDPGSQSLSGRCPRSQAGISWLIPGEKARLF